MLLAVEVGYPLPIFSMMFIISLRGEAAVSGSAISPVLCLERVMWAWRLLTPLLSLFSVEVDTAVVGQGTEGA